MGFEKLPGLLLKTLGTLRIRYMGLAFLIAWVYCLWFSDSVFSDELRISGETLALSASGAAAVFLAIGFGQKAINVRPNRIGIVCSIAMSLVTLLYLIAQDGPLAWAGAVASGSLSAILWIQWGELYCLLDQEELESNLSAMGILTVIVTWLVSSLPVPFSTVAAAVLPIAAGASLALCRGEDRLVADARRDSMQATGKLTPVLDSSLTFGVTGIVAFFSMVCSMVTYFVLVTSCAGTNSHFTGDEVVYAVVIGGCIAVALFFGCLFFSSRVYLVTMYRALVIVIMVSLALLSMGDSRVGSMGTVLAGTATFMTDCLFILVVVRMCKLGFSAPEKAFGMFRGALQLGVAAGVVLGNVWIINGYDYVVIYQVFVCICAFVPSAISYLNDWIENKIAEAEPPVTVSVPAMGVTSPEPVEPRVDTLDLFAAKHKLTPRERDVLVLFAKGRSVPYIRDALSLSKSTIETHVKHIYAKAGVHSKQELLDLIDHM